MSRRTERTDDAVRATVLAAADRLYYTRGVQAVGMDELRAEAGVSLKKLYQLFTSKETVIEGVLHRRHRAWNAMVETALHSGDTPREKLLAIYDMLARWFDEGDFRGCVFINAYGELGATMPQVARIVREHKADFQARLVDLVTDAGGPASLAHQLAILAEGAQTTAAIAGTGEAAAHARAAAETLIDATLGHDRRSPDSAAGTRPDRGGRD